MADTFVFFPVVAEPLHQGENECVIMKPPITNKSSKAQDSQGLLFPSDSAPSEKVPEKDDMFNYQCSFLEYGMLILNFFDAIKEGDGKRTFRCWKFQLPYLT